MNTLLNTPQERHAFAIGFFEVLCPWPAFYRDWLPTPECLEGEEHYYNAGRGLGFIALVSLVCLAIKWLL